ncbi:MAG: alanine racemase [Acidimicrobiaceae bacterium]|nr:alanine racemase [Acidimicrobiaceae bacterium]
MSGHGADPVAVPERGRAVIFPGPGAATRLRRVRSAAIETNVKRLVERAGGAALCAVVKADGYGHGAVTAARAALAGGASWLAVATIPEALEAAEAAESVGSEAPVLVLSELPPAAAHAAARACPQRVRFTVASPAGIEALAAARSPCGARAVHLKVDTGMNRMGAHPHELQEAAAALRAAEGRLRPEGVWTHLAVADQPRDPFTQVQLRRFDDALTALRGDGIDPGIRHAANSAGLLVHRNSHFDMVRAGIAVYGVAPSPVLDSAVELLPALELVSQVTALRRVEPGGTVSYGRLWKAREPTLVATLGIGYADGVRRDSGTAGVEALVGGHRCPIVGAVTMDQLMVAVPEAAASQVRVGDEAVLIGRQGDEEITVQEIARRLGTVGYEVLTSLTHRVRHETV